MCWCVKVGGVAREGQKKPIVGDGQRLHTAIRCFTQGISMLINQCVDLKPWANSRHTDFYVDQIHLNSLKTVKNLRHK